MKNFGLLLILLAVVLFAANWYIERRRKEAGVQAPQRGRRARQVATDPAQQEPDFTRPRPALGSFHVKGNEAQVTFDVPFPVEGDEVLADLLVGEAVEVVREKRHNLPISDVTDVVVFAGRENNREVGRMSLVTPGILPPPSRMTDILNLHSIGVDPLAAEFESGPIAIPETVQPSTSDDLSPLADAVRLPKAVETGLRTQGIDPDSMTAGDLVLGILTLFGYTVTPGMGEGHFNASRGGTTTLIVTDPYNAGDYPEVDEQTIRSFVVAVGQGNASRAMLVSEKFAPFSIYEMEKRDPRIRFITRERLQKFVDSMSLT